MQAPKKRILFLVQLPPPVHGAASINQSIVNSERVNEAFDCRVLELRFVERINEIGKFSPGKVWRMVKILFKLLYILIRWRPQMVYFTLAPTGSAFYRDALFALIIKCFPTTILYHLHGKGLAEDSASSSIKKKLLIFIFKNEYLIILGNSLKSDIADVYKAEPFILANGIGITPMVSTGQSSEQPVFLFLSNLVISKGIGIFLESLNILHQKGIAFSATVAGASVDMTVEEARKFVEEHQLEGKVNIAGALYGDAKHQAIASANILVFPTWYKNEALPLTILEAMQASLAVITTNNGAIAEVVDNGVTGFVVAQNNAEAITEKMELLAADWQLRKQMGENGRMKFLAAYTLPVFEKNLLNIFHQVLK